MKHKRKKKMNGREKLPEENPKYHEKHLKHVAGAPKKIHFFDTLFLILLKLILEFTCYIHLIAAAVVVVAHSHV